MKILAGIFFAIVTLNLIGCTSSCCGTPPPPVANYKGEIVR